MKNEAHRDAYLALCRTIIERVTEIDADTEWEDSEPRWWLDMMSMQKQAIRDLRLHAPEAPSVEAA